jgi:hypothetical protein
LPFEEGSGHQPRERRPLHDCGDATCYAEGDGERKHQSTGSRGAD